MAVQIKSYNIPKIARNRFWKYLQDTKSNTTVVKGSSGTSGSSGGTSGGSGTTYSVFTSTNNGLVPAPNDNDGGKHWLGCDATWHYADYLDWGITKDGNTLKINNNLQALSFSTSGNVSIGGTLGVTGKSTLGELSAGKSTLNSLEVSNNAEIKGTITVSGSGTSTFNDSVQIGGNIQSKDYAQGIITGSGWKIDKDGNAEMESMILRSFLEVPELRYNRVTVESGVTWNAAGAGIIKSVNTSNNTFELKLEDGEIGSFVEGDICMGIWNFANTSYSSINDTSAPDYADALASGLTVSGFCRVYFYVESVSGTYNQTVKYTIRSVKGKLDTTDDNWTFALHPVPQMTIVAYGNNKKENGTYKYPNRQKSWYATKSFNRYLSDVTQWKILPKHIKMQQGDLSNLTIGGQSMSGYSAYLDNVYFSGVIKDLPDFYKLTVSNQNIVIPCDNDSCALNAGEITLECALYKGDTIINDSFCSYNVTGADDLGIDCSEQYPNIKLAWEEGAEIGNGIIEVTASNGDISYTTQIIIAPVLQGNEGTTTIRTETITTTIEDKITSIETLYILHTTSSSSPDNPLSTSGWSTTKPTWTNGYYVWYCYKYTYESGTVKYSTPALLNNQKIRMCGTYDSTVTYHNDSEFLDIVIYNGNYYCPKGVSVTGKVPTNTTYWSQFSQFENLATSVLLANQGYIDVLDSGHLRIGQTTTNDGNPNNINTSQGYWDVSAGAIKHSKTGLELTKEGELKIPEGHIKLVVDNVETDLNDYFDYDETNPNLLGTDDITRFIKTYGTNSNTNGIEYVYKEDNFGYNIASNPVLKLTAPNTISKTASIYAGGTTGGGAFTGERLVLDADKTYTLSLWVSLQDDDDTLILNNSTNLKMIGELSLYSSQYNSTRSYTQLLFDKPTTEKITVSGIEYKRLGCTDYFTKNGYRWYQISISFTTNSTYRYFTWIPLYYPQEADMFVAYGYAKLEEGDKPTGILYDPAVVPNKLLATGIDISKGNIVATADNFKIQNNSGNTTMTLDEDGNLITSRQSAGNFIELNNSDGYISLKGASAVNDDGTPQDNSSTEVIKLESTYNSDNSKIAGEITVSDGRGDTITIATDETNNPSIQIYYKSNNTKLIIEESQIRIADMSNQSSPQTHTLFTFRKDGLIFPTGAASASSASASGFPSGALYVDNNGYLKVK